MTSTEEWMARNALRTQAPPPLRHLFRCTPGLRAGQMVMVNDGPSLCGVASAPSTDPDPDSPLCPDCAARSRKVTAVVG